VNWLHAGNDLYLKKQDAQETKLEKKGYIETISGKMVKKVKGGLIKGFPKVALERLLMAKLCARGKSAAKRKFACLS
jgi:hypothetical protein